MDETEHNSTRRVGKTVWKCGETTQRHRINEQRVATETETETSGTGQQRTANSKQRAVSSEQRENDGEMDSSDGDECMRFGLNMQNIIPDQLNSAVST